MITWKDFAINEWKSIVRSPVAGQTIGAKILWFVLVTLIVGQVSVLGSYLPILLHKGKPDINPVDTINRFLWGYFLSDLVLRIVLINIPATIIHQYLHCNINRKKIAAYLLVKALFNFPNAFGIGLWLSFSISNFGLSFSGMSWVSGVIVILFINTMLILLAASFHRLLFSILYGGIVITIIGIMEYFKIPIMHNSIELLFAKLSLGHVFFIGIPFFLLLVLAGIVYKKIFSFMYIDQLSPSKRKTSVDISQISPIPGWRLEWLLIYRNKRLRTMIFLMYGLMGPNFLLQLINANHNPAKPLLSVMPFFLISFYLFLFSSMWGQLGFIAESTFFDTLDLLPQSWAVFLRRKFLVSFGVLTVGAAFAVLLDFIVLDMKFFPQILCLYVFHGGISIFLVLYRSTLHRQRFEIDTSAWFNYQGTSFTLTDLLIMLVSLLPPIVFFVFIKFQITVYIVPLFIMVGGVNLLFYKHWMSFIHSSFLKRRYVMMEGFRAKI